MSNGVIFAKFYIGKNVQIARVEHPHSTVVFDPKDGFIRFLSRQHESYDALVKKYGAEPITEKEFAELFTDFMQVCRKAKNYSGMNKTDFYQYHYPQERLVISQLIVADWTSQCPNMGRGEVYSWIGRWVALSGCAGVTV
jgi:hypothetical protein